MDTVTFKTGDTVTYTTFDGKKSNHLIESVKHCGNTNLYKLSGLPTLKPAVTLVLVGNKF